MTGYSPSALRELVKTIGHQAIETDLRMLPDGAWDGSAEEGFYGASWDGRLPPVSGPTGKTTLKWYPPVLGASAGFPPGMNKTGDGTDAAGQPYYEYEIDAWASIYEPWMTRIEQAFQGWDDLPEPTSFDGPLAQMRSAVTRLTPQPTAPTGNDPTGSYNTNYVDVDLDSALATIQTVVGDFSDQDQGLLVLTFLSAYGPTRVRGIMFNQAQAAIVMGMALLGEQKVWQGAQKDIMAIADAGKASMRPGGAGGDEIDLEIVKAFVDVAKAFTPPPVQLAIDTAEGVLDIVDKLTPKKPEGPDTVQLSGYTPDEVASSIEEKVRTLDKKVFDSEYELKYTTLDGMLEYMWGNAATKFHINPGDGVEADLKNADQLSVHPQSLKKIGYSLVPQVAAYMGHAAEDAQAADDAGIWSRSYVGMLSDGPYAKWKEVLGQFDKVTTGSAAELVEAGKLLAIGAGWLEDTDGDSRTALAGVDDDIARGELGWDNTKPPPPPTYFTLPNGKRIPI